jgi:hypothetical protein
MTITSRRIAYTVVLGLAAIAMIRAAQFRFQEKEQAFRQACRDELQKLGITRDAAKAKYPTPAISMVSADCLPPGGSGDVVVRGKFVPGTLVLFANDNLQVVKENLTATEYRATVKVAPDIPPQHADVIAITPVTAISARSTSGGVTIGGRFEWNLEAANGWRIAARSPANKVCGKPAEDVYSMEFFRKGETAPFQKLEARHDYSLYEGVSRFSITQPVAGMGNMDDFQTLMKKMMDPQLTDAQRDQLIKQIEKAQTQMQANMQKMTDPAYLKSIEAEKAKFGCERLELRAQAGKLTGEMRCAPAVGTRIALTGTMKFAGR